MKYKTAKPFNILVSAYACGPNWGSEIGMGWNWVVNLSNYCKLHVLTELGFKKDIEERIPTLDLKYEPEFYYVDIGDKGRKLFWKQGSFLFYKYYRTWQKDAYKLALTIVEEEDIHIIHQLNMIGFREPGYLWKIPNHIYIWGPVGGFNQLPIPYLIRLKLRNMLFFSIKNAINIFQKYTLSRVASSAKNAKILIGATMEAQKELDRISGKKSILMSETGCNQLSIHPTRNVNFNGKTSILWVGRLQVRKALGLAIKSLNNIKHKIDFELLIIGSGEDEKNNKRLVGELGLEKICTFLGEIPNVEVQELMRKSHLLLFTSLIEGTPHVITEAIQNGLPVICHDTCGQGMVINETCGIKIPVIDPSTSIELFSKALLQFCLDIDLQKELSLGAFKRAYEISWDSKAREMIQLYDNVLREQSIEQLHY